MKALYILETQNTNLKFYLRRNYYMQLTMILQTSHYYKLISLYLFLRYRANKDAQISSTDEKISVV